MSDDVDWEALLGVDAELYAKAVKAVTLLGRASPDELMEIFDIGVVKSHRIMDMLQAEGIVGPGEGSEVRAVREPTQSQ